MIKKILKTAGILVGAAALAAAGYLLYVILSYHRIEDNRQITADAALTGDAVKELVPVGEDLKIVTMNMGFGAYSQDFDFFMDGGHGSWAKSKESAGELITGGIESLLKYQPDFLMLQEIDVDATRTYHLDEYELIRSLLPEYTTAFAVNYDSAFLFWPLYQPHGASKAGIALASGYEIRDVLRRSLDISGGFGKFLDLDRCYTINRIKTDNEKELVLINVHLSAYGADQAIMEGQRKKLFADMTAEYEKGNYVIVGGDFNHDMIGISNEYFSNSISESENWAKPFDFDAVPQGFTVAAREAVEAGRKDLAATCRDTGRPYDGTNDRWILDTFLVSDNIRILQYDTMDLDFRYSDHNPACMEFVLQ